MKTALLLAALTLGACAVSPQPRPGDISLYGGRCWGHQIASYDLGHGLRDDVWAIRCPKGFNWRQR